MTTLADLTSVRGRFARSVRLDANDREAQLTGYLPTARAREVVRRVIRGMVDAETGARAFSITGPYGSGKSSLAVFLDSLAADVGSTPYRTARDLLAEHDPATADLLTDAREAMGAKGSGFARAVITAPQREPITATVLRGLSKAIEELNTSQNLREEMASALRRAESRKLGSPSYAEVKDLMIRIAKKRPILLVIDEFGKNLEAFAESGADGDMYLLQELAEWAAKGDLPLVVVTIQHLAFEAYAADATVAKRREWAKVQGRFEDIPFVDSAAATRTLISVALEHADDADYTKRREAAAATKAAQAQGRSLAEVADEELIAACYPLHPSTLLVLPELCSRYGQNERTLFSFLASHEPLSVTTFLTNKPADEELEWIRLERVYDYFVESASTFVGVSREASRWIEIETTIRDAHGLTAAQQRVIKTIGVLNLVSSSGTLRASQDLIEYACVNRTNGTATAEQVQARLEELEHTGLITYRDFASEYRIWRGSDFDLNSALTIARRQVREQSLADILGDVLPLSPVVAARHTTERATLRAFKRIYADATTTSLDEQIPDVSDVNDGLLIYALEPLEELKPLDTNIPVVVVNPDDYHPVVAAAVEVAALLQVGSDPALPAEDRAVQREIAERTAYAQQVLDQSVAAAYDRYATWTWLNPTKGGSPQPLDSGFGTRPLSDVLDEVFPDSVSPAVPYETINRSELTSAGSRIRKNLLEALVSPLTVKEPQLGFDDGSAEASLYHATLGPAGVHEPFLGVIAGEADGAWRQVWATLGEEIESSEDPVSVTALLEMAMAPPFGLREGTATVLLTALLVAKAADLAIYEHGTFKPHLTGALSERMVKNPVNFAVKSLQASRPKRRTYLELIHDALDCHGLPGTGDVTVLSTVRRLVQVFQTAKTYTIRTTRFYGLDEIDPERTAAARDALVTATEPDVMLFETLPLALGFEPVKLRGGTLTDELPELAEAIGKTLAAIDDSFTALVRLITETILSSATTRRTPRGDKLETSTALNQMRGMATHLIDVDTLTPPVRRFVQKVNMIGPAYDPDSTRDWAVPIATGIVDGVPPPGDWRDSEIPSYLKHLRDVGAAFRRTALLAQASQTTNDGDPFDAFAVSITAPDGHAVFNDVATLSASHQQTADKELGRALDVLREVSGSRHDAIGVALAWIAKQAPTQTETTPTVHHQQQHRDEMGIEHG